VIQVEEVIEEEEMGKGVDKEAEAIEELEGYRMGEAMDRIGDPEEEEEVVAAIEAEDITQLTADWRIFLEMIVTGAKMPWQIA